MRKRTILSLRLVSRGSIGSENHSSGGISPTRSVGTRVKKHLFAQSGASGVLPGLLRLLTRLVFLLEWTGSRIQAAARTRGKTVERQTHDRDRGIATYVVRHEFRGVCAALSAVTLWCGWAALTALPAAAQQSSKTLGESGLAPKFIVVEALGYKDLNLTKYGVQTVALVGARWLIPSCVPGEPLEKTYLSTWPMIWQKGPVPTVLDVECWFLWDDASYPDSVAKLRKILAAARKARPGTKFGYYGLIPPTLHWPSVNLDDETFQRQWDTVNENAISDFLPYVDAVYPSLYTYSTDSAKWEEYATMVLQTARRFDKPAYCFLWPRYYGLHRDGMGPYLDRSYWRLELDTCYKYANGIVLYDSSQGKAWDPNAPWWQETLLFLQYVKSQEATPTSARTAIGK